jgi:DNA-directed RNA polymerase II subunit RPB1
VLGVDAASLILFKELYTVLSGDGQYINQRHIAVLVDTICHEGWLMPTSRHGINRVDKSAFSKANFEEQIEVLTDAAVFSHVDNITGVTETNTVGQWGKFGTGSVHIFAHKRDVPAGAFNKTAEKVEEIPTATAFVTNYFLNSILQNDGNVENNDEERPYAPVSPQYQPLSPHKANFDMTSPMYQPQSPTYDFLQDNFNTDDNNNNSPSHPFYYPSSPAYQPNNNNNVMSYDDSHLSNKLKRPYSPTMEEEEILVQEAPCFTKKSGKPTVQDIPFGFLHFNNNNNNK